MQTSLGSLPLVVSSVSMDLGSSQKSVINS